MGLRCPFARKQQAPRLTRRVWCGVRQAAGEAEHYTLSGAGRGAAGGEEGEHTLTDIGKCEENPAGDQCGA